MPLNKEFGEQLEGMPDEFVVDWVRVHDLADKGAEPSGGPSPDEGPGEGTAQGAPKGPRKEPEGKEGRDPGSRPGDRKRFQGVGPGRSCKWWFTNHAVILEANGRFVGDPDETGEHADWSAVLPESTALLIFGTLCLALAALFFRKIV